MSEIRLNEFINGNDSICREERQFALYLYNILDKQGSIVIKNNGEEAEYTIEKVFFEVSFLRDYFDALKKEEEKEKEEKSIEFNEALVKFARGRVNHPEELKDTDWDDLEKERKGFLHGHVNGWHNKSNVWEKTVGTKLPQYLMNAQPDIGMILKTKIDEYYLCFIECKYCSDFGKYPTKGPILSADEGGYHQLDVQNYIAEFLCDKNGMNAYYDKYPLNPLSPRCTMAAWFSSRNNSGRRHSYQYPDETKPVVFKPKLSLAALLSETADKTIVIIEGQLEFEK